MNKLIHWICVPIIAYSIIALVSLLKFPPPIDYPVIGNAASIFVLAAFVFYLRLSVKMAMAMLLFGFVCLWIADIAQDGHIPLWESALSLFIAAWLGQFYGHKLEGKKPSFLRDIQFLMIGPAWLIGHIFRKMGWKY